MKRIWSFWIFLAVAMSLAAQSRDDIRIYIPPVIASPEQAAYFQENFAMETAGAGYALTNNPGSADYTLNLSVKPNMILYEDGYEEPAPLDEPQFVLEVHLIRNEDDVEIVAFSFPFTDMDEMYDYNLYLLYEAMANVPFTKEGDEPEDDDRWRNKWIYIRASLDYPITFYQHVSDPQYGDVKWDDENKVAIPIGHEIRPWLAATLGLEVQYLYWMSTELSFNLSFGDPMHNTLMPSLLIEQKFPLKPSRHFMIEPYIAASFLTATSETATVPRLGLGGGVQLGVKGGDMGAFFVDVNFIYSIGNVVQNNTTPHYTLPAKITYNRFVLGLGIGYKIGFMDRPKR